MANKVDRAKQFLPFDAMKGLQEELRAREEKLSRVPRHELSEESKEELSATLTQINRSTDVEVVFYRKGHYYNLKGTVTNISTVYQYLTVGGERINFNDIYSLSIVDL